MNKRISLGAAIAFMFIVASATFSMTMIYSQRVFNERVTNLKKREVMYEKFTEIDRQVRDNYTGVINEAQLLDSIASGYIQGIGDKYAKYITAAEYDRMTSQSADDRVGIGIAVNINPDGYLIVTNVYPDSPAELGGIHVDDLIVAIDGDVLTIENAGAKVTAISGPQGTPISVVARRGSEEFSVEMTRRPVVIPTVFSSLIPNTTIAYIQISEFTAATSDQFNRELDRMLSLGAKSIIFDLRDNGGGVLRQATRILDRLVPSGVIYTAKRKDGTEDIVTSDSNYVNLPMAVLTNSGTASAAELFAQVLKDYEQAASVGTATAGKGAVQDIIKLSDGSAIDITVAALVSPKGQSFDGAGIKPDFEIVLDSDWTTLNHETDPQIRKAMEVVITAANARRVLEGG